MTCFGGEKGGQRVFPDFSNLFSLKYSICQDAIFWGSAFLTLSHNSSRKKSLCCQSLAMNFSTSWQDCSTNGTWDHWFLIVESD